MLIRNSSIHVLPAEQQAQILIRIELHHHSTVIQTQQGHIQYSLIVYDHRRLLVIQSKCRLKKKND